MAEQPKLPEFDPGRATDEMRAEAARRAEASTNWTMAALLTANGGGVATLLSHADRSLAVAIGLTFFCLGLILALAAGRLATVLAHHQQALHVASSHLQRVSSYNVAVRETGDGDRIESADDFLDDAQDSMSQAHVEWDKCLTPDVPLGLGVVAFAAGCLSSGVALFS